MNQSDSEYSDCDVDEDMPLLKTDTIDTQQTQQHLMQRLLEYGVTNQMQKHEIKVLRGKVAENSQGHDHVRDQSDNEEHHEQLQTDTADMNQHNRERGKTNIRSQAKNKTVKKPKVPGVLPIIRHTQIDRERRKLTEIKNQRLSTLRKRHQHEMTDAHRGAAI